MPLFDYRCRQCQATSRHLVGVVQDDAKPECPNCGSTDLEKSPLGRFAVGQASSGRSAPSCADGPACAMGGGCASGLCPMAN